jgi:hypothetical protein
VPRILCRFLADARSAEAPQLEAASTLVLCCAEARARLGNVPMAEIANRLLGIYRGYRAGGTGRAGGSACSASQTMTSPRPPAVRACAATVARRPAQHREREVRGTHWHMHGACARGCSSTRSGPRRGPGGGLPPRARRRLPAGVHPASAWCAPPSVRRYPRNPGEAEALGVPPCRITSPPLSMTCGPERQQVNVSQLDCHVGKTRS